MLSCEKVQELLPGLVTGEKASHDLREHLASCDACREVRDRLAHEIGSMREDLAALAPSPFLEDAVVEAAHETESVDPTRRPWRYVAVAFAAAAALFLVVLLPRLREGRDEDPVSVPGGDDESEDAAELVSGSDATIAIPPSFAEAGEARRLNAKALSLQGATLKDGFGVETQVAGGVEFFSTSETYPATVPGALHRWVYGDDDGRPGTRTHTMATLPSVEGVFFLGNGLLNEIGGTLHAGATGEILVGDKRWETTPGTMQGEITVGSPDTGGAEARIRVLVSTGYSGTLMLEDPLARALGLHQFEIPGRVDFKTPNGQEIPVHGWRARARVVIPELDFDRVVEVQVVRQRPWMVKRGRRSEKTGLLFRGLQPSSVIHADTLESAGDGGYRLTEAEVTQGERLENVEIGEGTHRLVYLFQAPGQEGVPMLPDIPILGELFQPTSGSLFPQALDLGPSTLHVVDVERVRVEGSWEPLANVTIARVWRGQTAIPSAEAVVQTQVRKSGRIAFPRIAGEAGSTLKMLVTKKDGTSTFHDVVVAPQLRTEPRIDIYLFGEDGTVRGRGWSLPLIQDGWQGDHETGSPPPKQFAALVEQLHLLRERAGEDEERKARTVLVLHADREAPWRMVQWVMMAAAHPRVEIRRIRLGPIDAAEKTYQDVGLPVDGGLFADPQIQVTVTLARSRQGGPLVIRYGSVDGPAQVLTWDQLGPRLRAARARYEASGPEVVGLLRVPPPGLVTSVEASRVIDAFRQAGIEDVQFEGAPLR